MSTFRVKCAVGDHHFCIEVPTNCSVNDVLKKASDHAEVKGVSLWYSDVPLSCEHLFADYFEPEIVYHVRMYPDGTLL
jgi:hypothetical protein